jgi:hypothetical protein
LYSRFSTHWQSDSSIADQVRVCTTRSAGERISIIAASGSQT